MANIEHQVFREEEFNWAHKELENIVKSCGTSDSELEELGELYYELILEYRKNPPLTTQPTRSVKGFIHNGEQYFSIAEEPRVIARMNRERKLGNISAGLAIVVPLISELVGYVAGIDTRPFTLTGFAGGVAGWGMSQFFIFWDKNAYLPESYPFWEQKPQLSCAK
jgi:hypothetical protein